MRIENVNLQRIGRQARTYNPPGTANAANDTFLDDLFYGQLHFARLKSDVSDVLDLEGALYNFDVLSTMIPSHIYPLEHLGVKINHSEDSGYYHGGMEEGPLLTVAADKERGAILLAHRFEKTDPPQPTEETEGDTSNDKEFLLQRSDAPHSCRLSKYENSANKYENTAHRNNASTEGITSAADVSVSTQTDNDAAGSVTTQLDESRKGPVGRGDGGSGKVCSDAVERISAAQIAGDVEKLPNDLVPYFAVVWYWAKEYARPTSTDPFGLPPRDRLYHELMSRFERGYIKMIMTVIPNGNIVWVPVVEDIASDVHTALIETYTKLDNSFPVYVLEPPIYLDGPDIFIADCNFR